MEHKQNSLSRVKRHQSEKVFRFSIRKYSFGAASVAVAALMFLGARVASADSVSENTTPSAAGVVNPKDEPKSPQGVAEPTGNKVDEVNKSLENQAPAVATNSTNAVDKAKLRKVVEELNSLLSTKLNLDDSVVSPIKNRLQKGKEALESSELAQKDIDELVELLSKDVTVLSAAAKESTEVQVDKTEKQAEKPVSESSSEVSASEESQTVSAKKDALKVSVDQLQAAILEVPEHDTTKEVLEKANELLGLAQVVLENTTVSLNEVEEMTKRVKRMFNSVKNASLRLTSGSHDPRNGQRIAQGTSFRANGQISSGALANIKYFASVDPKTNNGNNTRNNDPEFTRNKTDVKAYYMEDSQGKWIVYDVFFNNDGRKMTQNSYQQHYYFQAPFNIMDSSNTVKDLTFTRYENVGGRRLSDDFQGFKQYGNTATISNPWGQQYKIFNNDGYSFYDPNSGVTRDNQRWDVFKNNQYDSSLNQLTKDKNNRYPGLSYYLGIDVGKESSNYAVHMHAKIKLKNNITEAEANAYGRVYAASVTKGATTNQSYIMGTLGTSLTPKDTTPPTINANGATVTKNEKIADIPVTATDNRGGVGLRDNNPIEVSGLPQGLTFTNGKITGTPTGPVGNSTVTIKAYDKNGNKAEKTITITVKDQASKYNPTGETLTVNQGQSITDDAVKAKVKNYAPGTLSVVSKPSTAKAGNVGNAVVKVTYPDGSSDTVNVPVTVLKAPDTQPPTLTVTPAEQIVKVGEKILFNLDGRDDTKVNLDFSDIATKYGNHLFTLKSNYSVNTDKQKTLSIDLGAAKETDIGEKTVTFKATDDAGHEVVKTVKVKVVPATKENATNNPTAETVVVGIKQELTDEAIIAKVKNYPSNARLSVKQKPDTDTTGNKTATVIVTYSDKSTDEVTVPVVVRDTTPPKIYWAKDDGSKVELGKTHAEGQNIVIPLYRGDAVNTRLITTDDSGNVTNFKMENLQSGFNFTPVNGTATEGSPLGQNVTGTVGLGVAKGKYTARAISTDGTNSTTGYFVFEVHEQAEKYTPAANTLTVPFNHTITDDEVKGKVIAKPGTPAFPTGTILEVVSKPATNTTGTDKKAVVKITYPDKSTENIDVPVHVGKDLASQHPLEGRTVTVTVGDSLRTWQGRVDSNQYTDAPKGRGNGVQWGWKGTTPKALQDTAGVFKYTATATHTDKSVAESDPQVTVIVKPKAPTIETDLTGKAELPNTAVVVNVHDGVKDGSIVTLYSQDGRAISTGTVANGKATVTGTIPKGNITAKTTVQTAGEQDVTSDPSPEKVATTNKAALYPIKGKTATVTVGDSLRSWKGRVDANQYTDAGPNGKGIGVEWGWEGTAPKILQDTAGVFKYTATATHTDKTVAKSNPQVTIIVKPKAPTIETDLTGKSNQENVPVTVSVGGGVKDGSIVTLYGPDGTTVIGTGTVTNGKATAIITGKVPVGNITAKTTVQTPGQDDVVSEPSPIKEATNIVPTAKTQTVGHKEQPIAKNSIGNNGDLPNGTDYTWKTTPDTSTPGDKPGIVTVTYPDGSTIDIPVTVIVTPQKDTYTPTPVNQTVGLNKTPEAKDSIGNKNNLPNGTTYVWKETPDTSTAGDKPAVVLVTYPDKTVDEVPVTVKVTQVSDDYTPKYNDGRGKPGSKVDLPLKEENNKKIPDGTTFESDQPGVITVDDKGKVTVTIPKDKNPGDKITGKVTVTYPDGSKDEVPVNVTVVEKDKGIYTPKYEDGNGKPGSKVEIPLTEENGKKIPDGTTFESDQPGVITVDDKGKVTVTIPKEANPGDKITGKVTVTYPDGSKDEVPVNVTVTSRDKDDYTPKYEDGNGKPGSKVEIPLKEENGKKIPDGTTFESDQPGVITVDDKGKVTVTIPKEANPGDKITGKVTVTYPDGSKDEVPVNVTVTSRDKDDYTPKYEDGNGKPGSKVEIPLKEENGKKIPDGTTFESDQPGVITVDDKGKVTVTIPKEANPGDKITGKVTVTYPDGSKDEVPVNVTVVEKDKGIYTPKYEDGNGKPGSKVEIPLTEENGKKIPDGTTFESDQPGVITVDDKGKVTVTIPKEANPGDKITGKVTVTYPDGSKDEVPVNVTVVEKDKGIYTPKYEDGNGKPGSKVEIPLTEENGKKIPDGTTFESDQPGVITVDDKGKVTVTIPKEANPGDKITGKVTVTYPDGSKDEVPVNVTVTNRDKDEYTPKYEDETGKPGSKVEIPLTEENDKKIPDGTTFESDQPGVIAVDKDGKVTVTIPEGAKPGDKITGKVLVRYPDGSTEEVPVTVTVGEQDKDIYTPKYDDGKGKPGTEVEIPLTEENDKKIPDGTTFESDQPGVITVDDKGKVTVTIPKEANPGDKITGKVTVTYPDGSKEEIPVTVTVGEQDKDIYTPKYEDGNGKPGSKVEIPLTEENGKKIPDGTTFESDQPGVITVDKDGKVTVKIPKEAKPGDKITGKVTVTYPDGSTEKIPVTVTVGEQDKDIYTPKYEDGNGKPGSKVEIPLTEENGKKIPDGTTFESDQPGVIDVDKDGKVTVTIPEGSKPGDKITGKITVTYPDGSKEEIPVTVTVGEQDKDIYTPKYEDGNGKPGSKVEIPLTEENGKKIPDGTTFESDQPGVITVDKDGKVTVKIPKEAKPGDKITGKVTVTYPDGSTEKIPVTVTVGEQDKDIYTPKYEDGNGKPGSKVEIPLTEENGKKIPDGTTFESDQPGVIDVDKDGKVTVTIPEGSKPGDKITGKITVTYPDGSKEEIPVTVTVTTPAQKTPTVYVEQDPKTGDVTVTPKKPDGSTYPPGTKVEIPGKDGNPITVTIGEDGKGKVPNSELPDGKVPGTAKITEPGKPAVEVPNVTTPGKVTSSTPTDTNPVAPVTPDTPVKPDTNGGSGQDTPAPATPTPNAVTPNADQVDTKTTVDNGAKSNDSQNVLPNTGTESNATLASLGLLGMLGGLGLALAKKKED